jgi:hypothetical protein
MKLLLLILVASLMLGACGFPPPGGLVTLNMDSLPATYYFDGPCVPRLLSLHGTLSGDVSLAAETRYRVQVYSDSGRSRLVGETSGVAEISPEGRFRHLAVLDRLIPTTETADELYGDVIISALDTDGRSVGETRRSFAISRCQPGEMVLSETIEISPPDLYAPGCLPSEASFLLRLSGAIGRVRAGYIIWEVLEPGSPEALAEVRRPLRFVDRTGDPTTLPMIEFSDRFVVATDMAFFFEIPSEPPIPLPRTGDPLAIIRATALITDVDGSTLVITEPRDVELHPCEFEMLIIEPSATPTPEPTPTVIPASPTRKSGDDAGGDGGGGGGASCSDYGSKDKCTAAGCSWDPDKMTCN